MNGAGLRQPGFVFSFTRPGKPGSLQTKQNPKRGFGVSCYPTWIRTKTSRTRICGTTVILSGNEGAQKQAPFQAAIYKLFCPSIAGSAQKVLDYLRLKRRQAPPAGDE